MDEVELIKRRNDWKKRYDRRRVLVLILEALAALSWVVYGLISINSLDFLSWVLYWIVFVILFIPGLLFVIYDIFRTRNMDFSTRIPTPDAEPEDTEFTTTILKSSWFLALMLFLIVVPAFFLVNLHEAYQWTYFFTAIFTLVIATLAGACWRLNTSWNNIVEK